MFSKYYHGCKLAKEDPTKTENHQLTCELNYEGPSGDMEMTGVKAIFSWSQMNQGAWYLTYLGNSDSRVQGYYRTTILWTRYRDYQSRMYMACAEKMGARLRALCKSQKGINFSNNKTMEKERQTYRYKDWQATVILW